MKRTSKVFAVVLAVAMVLSMASVAFADTQYTVVKGDWLSKIAPRYNTTWQKLAEYNKLKNPNLIFPGQIINIPDSTPAPAPTPVADGPAALAALDVHDISEVEGTKNIPDTYKINIFDETKFAADTLDYAVTVQSDIYGVLLQPKAAAGSSIKSVTADVTTYNYTNDATYTAGEEIPYAEAQGGYIVYLSQTREAYDSEFKQVAKVVVGKEGAADVTYTVTITRECENDMYAKFQQGTFDFNGVPLDYNIYYPEGYETSGKKYPVVLALHGAGQTAPTQPLDMVIRRYQMALSFAKDSEAGHNECIIIAPQYNREKHASTWSDNSGSRADLGVAGQAAYALLETVLAKDYADTSKVYVTGASMGGYGTWSMISSHPETFAGAVVVCGGTDLDNANWEGIKTYLDGKIFITHAKDDRSEIGGVPFANGKAAMDKLDEMGIKYNSCIFDENTIFYPTAHFSWTPTYADKQIRDWLFAQSKYVAPAEDVKLTGLDVKDSTLKKIFGGFVEGQTAYEVTVQADIYGVLVAPKTPEGVTVTVTADKDAKAYGGDVTYKAGDEIAFNESFGGYLVPLGQDYADYDSEFVQTATVKLQAGSTVKEYTVKITRECDADTYKLFQALSYTDPDTGVVLPYLLYVPTDYDASKSYPVVFALHGSGQRTQPLDMLLKRYQMATVFAKDSEKGHNQCIILAPQCTVEDPVHENWTTLMSYRAGVGADAYETTDKLEAAYRLLLKVMDEYSADKNRVYMHGLSAGGFATFTLATEYPETFAAIAPDAGGGRPADMAKLKGMPIWIFQAEDDPTVPVSFGLNPTREALDAAGVDYKLSLYKPGEVFYPSAHFSWVPMYADETFRDWLFAQSK